MQDALMEHGPAAQLPEPDRRPQLLIYNQRRGEGFLLVSTLRRAGVQLQPIVVDDPGEASGLDGREIDVAAIGLGEPQGDALVLAAQLGMSAPWIEFVFWADELAPGPAVQAARSLGIGRIIAASKLGSWLTGAFAPLARLARAKRVLLEAQAALPATPAWASSPPTRMALPEAERRFRETYLRRLLSETRNARHAAERAGVPYTTLCSMMKKLGIRRSEGEEAV